MLTDRQKIDKLRNYFESFAILEEDYCEDVYSDSGGNFDDAYDLGYDYASSNIARCALSILGEFNDV